MLMHIYKCWVIHHSLITCWTCDHQSVPSQREIRNLFVCVYTCTQYYVIMFKYTLWLDGYPQSYHIIMMMESDDHVFLWNTFSALNSACTVPLYLESNWTLTSIMTVQSHSLTSCHNADLFEKYVFFSKIMWFKLQHDMKSKRKLWKGWKEPLTWQRQTPTINGLN